MRAVTQPLRSAARCTRHWFGLCLIGLIGLPVAAPAQRERAAPAPDVILLKRIAEAVDGHRTGELVYVVASPAGDHPVAGVFSDPRDADRLLEKLGKGFFRFGPYQSPRELAPPLVVACVHIRSVMLSERCVPPAQPTRFEDVTGLTLVIARANGKPDSLVLPPGTDAIFLTLSTIDKFVVPYYLRTFDIRAVSDMRQGFQGVFTAR
jgi:hypothetical protein